MSRKRKKAMANEEESRMEAAAGRDEAGEETAGETTAEQGEDTADASAGEETGAGDENGPQTEPVEVQVDPLEKLQAERDELKEKWLRAVAELDNLRKRSRRELVDGRRFAQAEVLRAFLEVQDNFERALQSMNSGDDTEGNESHKGLREGFELIFQNFRRVLKDQGVQPIEALEQEFDPAVHEAVGQFEREGVEPGKVIEVVQQGFHLGDMVLRPSRVIISG